MYIRESKYVFKKGQIVHLDSVYAIQGLFPNDATLPCNEDGGTKRRPWDEDETDNEDGNPFGDHLKFQKNITLNIKVRITG